MPSFYDGRRAVGTLTPSAAAVFGQCGLAKREEPSEKRNNDTNEGRDSGNDRSVLCGPGDLALLSLKGFIAPLGLSRLLYARPLVTSPSPSFARMAKRTCSSPISSRLSRHSLSDVMLGALSDWLIPEPAWLREVLPTIAYGQGQEQIRQAMSAPTRTNRPSPGSSRSTTALAFDAQGVQGKFAQRM